MYDIMIVDADYNDDPTTIDKRQIISRVKNNCIQGW